MEITGPVDEPVTNGIVYIAYREDGHEMTPVARGGRLATFETLEAAKAASGALGVAAPTTLDQVARLCRRHGLGLPKPTKKEEDDERKFGG
jgi:hypothetical protein